MSEWAAKRFWKTTAVVPQGDGFGIELDGRPVKTPAKATFVVPTPKMAAAAAAEWDAQVDLIDPLSMPVTRGANAAIDKVAVQRDEVIAMLAAYGDADLLCYRADAPDELVALQNADWDPLLAWARDDLGATLVTRAGVMHAPQNPDDLARLTAELEAMTPFQIAGAHDLIALSGSLIIALAVMKKRLSAEEGWRISRVDEDFQISQWGEDDESRAQEMIKHAAFLAAAEFFEMSIP